MLGARSVSLIHDSADYSRITASKTPGRTLKGRAGLQENVLQNGSLTTNPKEKRVALQTPLRQDRGKIILQDAQIPSKVATQHTLRPLGDKTPKPNRQSLSLFTPGPRNGKITKFNLPTLEDEQDENETRSPSQPPSASRKKLRTPRASKAFETPVTKGDYWNVSDVSIEEGTSITGDVNEVDVNESDCSEPEYMPPKTVEPTYESSFELPDYKEVGNTLRTIAYSYPIADMPIVYEFDSEDLLKGCEWSVEHMGPQLPEYDDEIFGPRSQERKAQAVRTSRINFNQEVARSAAASKGLSVPRTKRTNAFSLRPATAMAVRSSNAKPTSSILRPGTSASNSRPLETSNNSKGRVCTAQTVPSRATSTNLEKENLHLINFDDDLEVEDFHFTL